ncbi:MAG: NADP-dependent malic enzyme [Paludibacteraceae bacterium]|nr:NADP-dependent malic enzyme [Paludibacteraceae bacterium]
MSDEKKQSEALKYHAEGRPGKIQVIPTKPTATQRDLSLAYSPGVAEPCLEIQKDPQAAYKYTAKGNLVAVISNGTAVLGLGDIGAEAGKPVMEGKGLLFKIFADIDVFDIEVNEKNIDKFCETVKAIAPTFGGINLEDIKAPECFEIEDRLKAELDIPLMHDDQHGTAIISSAALINALDLVGKKIEDVKIVVNGAGAAANSCTKLYMALGARLENIVMCDSKGVINTKRTDLNDRKKPFATSRDITTLEEAVKGADVFLGLSKGNVLSQDMVRSMAKDPIVFALANPVPEISYDDAMASRPDIICGTGRSDYPNQINNVLGFPYIFRGALDTHAKAINEEMKLAAVRALADLAKLPVPEAVAIAYNKKNLKFGKDYIIPAAFDPRLLETVAPAVAKAAMESGVARKNIENWDEYKAELRARMGLDNTLIGNMTEAAKKNPKKVVYTEANNANTLSAASTAKKEGICIPILLGNEERIAKIANENGIDIEGIEIINLRHDREEARRNKYAKYISEKLARKGYTYAEANEKMYDRNYFGAMMVEMGDADAMITGSYTKYMEAIKPAIDIIGLREGVKSIAALNILNTPKGAYFMADTLMNDSPSAEDLAEIAALTNRSVKLFNEHPVMAMLSYSNFGADTTGNPCIVHEAVELLHKNHPEMDVDGEMQVNFALDKKLRHEKFPFSKIDGKDVNTLVFPCLNSANIAYRMLMNMGIAESVGPVQMGLNKPVHVLDVEASVRDIVNMTTIAVIDAQINAK